MTDLIEIQKQIALLQKKESDIKNRDFNNTISDILAKMSAFGITMKDLQSAAGAKGKKVPASKSGKPKATKKVGGSSGKTVAVKFRGPQGETWSGRGLAPRWLAALIAQGRKKEEFAIS